MVNGFKFRLENVLNLKENIEELIKRELSMIRDDLGEVEGRLDALLSRYRGEMDTLLVRGDISPAELSLYKSYLSRIRKELEIGRGEVERMYQASEEKREELLNARKERKKLEVMKEKGYKEYVKKVLKTEQMLLDEFNSNKFKKEE